MSRTAVGIIDAILFDMNGTLRRREPHEPTQHAAITRMLDLLGMDDASEAFWDELAHRQKLYGRWAQHHMIQLTEEEIWTSWILPEFSPEKVGPVAAELTLAWNERKGRIVPRLGAEQTIVELRRRGYRLGVISNSWSTLDIPRSMETFGWKEYFEVVILSSEIKSRKPAPEPFLEAARALGVIPGYCAYIGNRVSKDLIGCKRAGFALGIIFEPSGDLRPNEQGPTIQPDKIIHSLQDLLEIFPQRTPMGDEE